MKSFCLILGLVCCHLLGAQRITPTVVSNAGNAQKAGSYSLEWTLGEFMVETLKGPSATITQGFHQTNLTVVSTVNPGIAGLNVYPNPFTDFLTLENHSQQVLQLHLLTIDGKCIESTVLQLGNQNWSLQHIPAGSYLLEATTEQQRQIFTIEKLH